MAEPDDDAAVLAFPLPLLCCGGGGENAGREACEERQGEEGREGREGEEAGGKEHVPSGGVGVHGGAAAHRCACLVLDAAVCAVSALVLLVLSKRCVSVAVAADEERSNTAMKRPAEASNFTSVAK